MEPDLQPDLDQNYTSPSWEIVSPGQEGYVCFQRILTGVLCNNIQAQVTQLHKRQHASDDIPEGNDRQCNPLIPRNASLAET